jgi:hypothetical protein
MEIADILASLVQPQQPSSSPYAQPGATPTQLPQLDEMAFQQWAQQNKVPVTSDYDMRGFYRGLQQQNPRAVSAINPNDQRMHYPDYWKMPTHQTFSQESKWALPVAPRWNELDQLVSPGGRIMFDERR